jgi:polyisoprenoid-binding protein YceI
MSRFVRFAAVGLFAVAVSGVVHVAVPVEPAAAAAAVQESRSYNVDAVHTAAVFKIQWNGMGPFYGQFTEFSGSMSYGGEPMTFACDVTVPVSSIDTHNAQRNRHLMAPEYFDARQHPELRFVSTGVTANDDGTHTLTGDLTLRGVTKSVEATLHQINAGSTPRGERVGADITLTFNRSDFGMTEGVDAGSLGDEVTLMVGLQGVAG